MCAQRLGPIDLALLPIGAYEPRWFMRAVHMNPAEAVQAHLDLEAAESVGMHFGTFQLTTEGIDAPLHALDEARLAKNIPPSRFRTLGFGDSLRVTARALRHLNVGHTAWTGALAQSADPFQGRPEEPESKACTTAIDSQALKVCLASA